MPKTYPRYADHNRVICFNCDSPLGSKGIISKTGMAPGNGEYLQRCKHCGMFTCYDLETVRVRSDAL
jgi:RNase P subunit RPR2